MVEERIGLLGREGVAPTGVCLAVDLVTCAALEEVSTTSALPPLDLPLPDGSDSCLTSGPLLPWDCTRLIRKFWTVMLPNILKGLQSIGDVVALSSLLMKVEMGVCKNLGMGLAIVVDFGVNVSSGIGNSRIHSTGSATRFGGESYSMWGRTSSSSVSLVGLEGLG